MSERPAGILAASILLGLAAVTMFFGVYLPGHLEPHVPLVPAAPPPPLPPHVVVSFFVADWSVIASGIFLCGRPFGFGVIAAWLMTRQSYRLLFFWMAVLVVAACRPANVPVAAEDELDSVTWLAAARGRLSTWLANLSQWLQDDD